MAGGFILPGATDEGQIIDATKLSQRRKIAEAMALQGSDYSPIASPWQGLARVAQGALGGYETGQIDRQEADERKRLSGLSLFDDDASPARANVASALSGEPAPPAPGAAAARPPSFTGGGSTMRLPADPDIEKRFVDTLKAGGLTNPNGLAAVAAYANHESGYKPGSITGSWSDPSESGQPGTSGGILSWRGDRLVNMRKMTAGAVDPVEAQAKFTLAENPALTQALQNAKTPEEANRLMAEAWKFAGYNRPGGENAARLASTQGYLTKLNGSPQAPATRVADALADVPAEGAQAAEFRIPGQSQGQAGVADALNGSGRKINLRNAMEMAGSQYATPQQRAIGQALMMQAVKPQEPKMTSVAPGGTLIDERTGKVLFTAPDREHNKPMVVSPGASVYVPGSAGAAFTAPDRDKSIENDRKGREEAGSIRKEIHSLPSYKNYSQAHPIYSGMVETADRDSKASDLNLVYGLGKIMDPGSVVREGEIQMAQDTQGIGDRLNGMIRGVMGGARLSPEARKQILTEAYGRMQAYEGAFNQDATGYRSIVGRGGMKEADVLPNFAPVKPYEPAVPAAGAAGADKKAPAPVSAVGKKTIGGKTYTKGADGQWYEG